jgi:hypothetical protein
LRLVAVLAALLLPLVVPTSVLAGDCPASLPGGVVEADRYRLGDTIEFFGTFTDFADPGTVTITLERTTDGEQKTYEAFRLPDGAWMLQLQLDSADFLGSWSVTVVVQQTSGTDACTDEVTITGMAPPNTNTAVPGAQDGPSIVLVVALAFAVALALVVSLARPILVIGSGGRVDIRRDRG